MNGKPAPVLAKLRELGYYVHVDQKQFDEPLAQGQPGWMDHATPIKAQTIVTLHDVIQTGEDPDGTKVLAPGEIVAQGTASCSMLDQFNRSLGLRIALGRLLHDHPDIAAQVR